MNMSRDINVHSEVPFYFEEFVKGTKQELLFWKRQKLQSTLLYLRQKHNFFASSFSWHLLAFVRGFYKKSLTR